MNALEPFTNVVLPVFIMVGIGYLVRLVLKLDLAPLTKLALYVLGPSLVFSSLARTDVGAAEGLGLVAVMVSLAGATLILSFLLARILGWDRSSRNSFALTIVFMNSGNFGLGITLFAFGPAGLERALIIFVVQSLMLNTVAVYLTSSSNLSTREALGSIARMPVVYAAVIALLLLVFGIEVPDPVFRPIEILGNAAVPVLLLTLGIQLVETPLGHDLGKVTMASAGRLLVSPVIAFGLAHLFGLPGLAAKVAVLMAGMPTAIFAVLLAIEFSARPRFVASVVLATTAASALTITGILVLLM